MRKSLIYVSALALSLSIASCSNEGEVKDPESTQGFETNYLSVNLVQAPDMGTRADATTGTQTSGDPNATYEDGIGNENAVSSVRFYFFNDGGAPVSITDDSKNYFDWSKEITSTNPEDPNVEKQFNAVVVLHTTANASLPTKVVALLNPNAEILNDKNNKSLSDLQGVAYAADYSAIANSTSPSFIMANSVYSDGKDSPSVVIATTIKTENYASSEETAKNNPVDIYVERSVAKVRVKFNGLSNNRVQLKDKDDKDLTVGNQNVYFEVKGWNLTAETDKGNLFKSIDANWEDANLWTNWNYAPYFRSFWAQNAEGVKQSWHSYNELVGTDGTTAGKSFNGGYIYTNENAPQTIVTVPENSSIAYSGIQEFTKVILAGNLVNESGNALNITKYAGITSADDESFTNLKNSVLGGLNSKMIYYKDAEGFKSMDVSDVEFVKASTVGKAEASDEKNETTTGRYYVYLQLSATGKGKTWYKSNTVEAEAFTAVDAVNAYLLANLEKAQVYKGGMTYYYFPIAHLGNAGKIGKYGVVRNHIYDCNITKIVGLGTPVYDPTEKIYPEQPIDDETYLAARINILSWRLVTQDIELNW